MHDVRVALKFHELGHPYRAVFRYPTEVVPSEIDEHHVFGALLLIELELFGQPVIFGSVPPPRPCASNRVRDGRTSLHPDKHLGRRAHDRERPHPDVIHVG